MSKQPQDFKYWMKVLRREVKLHQRELDTSCQEEDAYFALISQAGDHIDELISAFRKESKPHVRWYVFKLIGDARSSKALPVFAECLQGDEEPLWSWTIYGLRDLDTREARELLWGAKSYVKATPELTEHFRSLVEDRDPTYTVELDSENRLP